MVFLKADKTFTSIFSEYADFGNIFFKDLVAKLPKYTGMNNHTINQLRVSNLSMGQFIT